MNQCQNGATEKTANRDNRPKTIEQKVCLKNNQKYAFGKILQRNARQKKWHQIFDQDTVNKCYQKRTALKSASKV